ncbi:SCO7613 C-terminal domain-containing membrane protein [Streptomyces sp. SP18CS02]|uniref:SCO7613 C-terminal domain-containing membrane protein n=1 Tax=Streptomyces sp. SP18CS02 TaxID=3002531 RepID=UPI002E781143|nr:hypothetical protein [Streptomyces sp. SP18CS02]MEE1752658.1 hypothetical protein [Streptomyces sp. SP18CS02]
MENVPPPAEELAILDHELALLDARRARLLARRAWLLGVLNGATVPPAPLPAPWPDGPRGSSTGSPSPFAAPRPAETTAHGAQNVLLTLGGVLLAVAAIAFTLFSWGHLGIGGRAAVLATVTVAALAAPVTLLRRGLAATAESVAALGLVLMVLDAYALHRVAMPEVDGPGYAAVVSGVLAAVWAAYGTRVGALRLPLPVAVGTAQLTLPLGALASAGGGLTAGWALLVTAGLDVLAVLAVWRRPGAARDVAGAGAVVTGGGAVLTGTWLSLVQGGAAPAVLLLVASAVSVGVAWRVPAVAVACAAAGGAVAVAGAGGLVREVAPAHWGVPGYLLCAVILAAAVRGVPARGVRLGLAGASAAVQGLTLVWALPPVAAALMTPATQVAHVWSDVPVRIPEVPWTSLVVVLTVAGSAAFVRIAAARCAALVLACTALMALPVTLPLPYAATVAAHTLVVAVSLVAAVRPAALTWRLPAPAGSAGPDGAADTPDAYGSEGATGVAAASGTADASGASDAAGPALAQPGPDAQAGPPAGPRSAVDAVRITVVGCALAAAVAVAVSALAVETASLSVAAALTVLFAGAALTARPPHGADAGPAAGLPEAARTVQTLLACVTVAAATGFVAAAAVSAGLPVHGVALALLAVPAATAALGARLRRHPVALPVELTGAGAALLAVGLATPRPAVLALVLGLCGVIAAATAVRPERRPAAGCAATALLVLAAWVRLAVWEVSVPEAYTLPVTVPAVVVGALRRRGDPGASSWSAYGPGLAATLLPSLFAAWTDAQWVRPLVLGGVALALTLAGARLRLQALLVLGGAVLALDGLHELAPYVMQVVGVLPRWLPLAVAGLLLLGVGATYEQRLRDARRLREVFGRMR